MMELNPGQQYIEVFCGMSYEPGKSLHQPPAAMRPALRPAGVDLVTKAGTFLFPTLLTFDLYFFRRDEALSHHDPLWLIPLILTVRADMPQ